MNLLPHVELRPQEAMLHISSLSWWTQAGVLAVGVCLLPAGGLGMLAFAIAWWRVRSVRLWVTTQRVVLQQGILARHHLEVPIRRIDTVTVDQGLLQRIAGIGDLQVSVEGTNRVQLDGMVAPLAVRSAIWRAQAPGGR